MTRIGLCVRAATLALVALAYLAATASAQSTSSPAVSVGQIDGIVNPATATYVDRVLTEAERSGAPAVVFTLNTPGGVTDAVRDINLRVERSTVPVLAYRPESATAYAANMAGLLPDSRGAQAPIAGDVRTVPDLLRQADGATVHDASGPVTLQTAGAPTRQAVMSPFEALLHAAATPTVAYLLLSVGCLGLLLEFFNPGSIVPGVIGGVCLVVAFYALGSLPLNGAGLLLIGLAMLLFALEPLLTSHGILAVGGTVAFVLGSAMLVNATDAPYLQIAPEAIGAVTVALAGFFFVLAGFILRARRRRAMTGHEGLVGATGVVRRDIEPRRQGMVLVQGELWRATAIAGRLTQGEQVIVERVEGLVLVVRRASRLVPAPRPAAPAEAKSRAAGY
jgi:membrane-bound ClpP family serine protease